jgi:micrococcal nuclease
MFPQMTGRVCLSRMHRWTLLTCLATVLVLLHARPPVLAQQFGVVERVVDGDTVIVTGIGSVRLIGVDTPETVHPNNIVEHFGRESSNFVRQLLTGRQVRLEYDVQRRDRYRRLLAYVYLLDGTFVNAEIIRQGYGHAYTQFPFRFLDDFRQLEREAREQKRGLWRDQQ